MTATLELTIRHPPESRLIADAQLTSDVSAASARLADNIPVVLDQVVLNALSLDPVGYGRELSAQLFANPHLRDAWLKARAYAATTDLQLRLKLDASDATLHDLCWELLRDPETSQPIALYEHVRLVRALDSADLTPVVIPPRPELRALVIVSNPSNLGDFKLAEVDVEGEVSRARTALGDIPTTILGESSDRRATLANITAALRDAPPIVILVAHGTIKDDTPYVWLEQDDGATDRVTGDTIAETLRRLSDRPLLFVLASCRSAGSGYGDALSALGPRLAGAGVPAVLAFQGDVAMSTIKTLLPTLIAELRRDGQIDRALAAARGALGERRPWWQAVLWLRTDGRLWKEEAPTPASPGGISIGGNVDTIQVVTVTDGNVGSIIGSQHNYSHSQYHLGSDSPVESRRFEAAMPRTCEQGLSTEVRCMIALSSSEGLRKFLPDLTESGDWIRKDDVRANDTPIEFPEGALLTVVHLELRAPDFLIDEPVLRLSVRRGVDSGIATFVIEPRAPRRDARVFVRLFQDAQRQVLLDTLTLMCEIRAPSDAGPPSYTGQDWAVTAGRMLAIAVPTARTAIPIARIEAITVQRQRLEQHRATLAHYLGQLALTGSAHARPEVTAGIREARAGIAQAKGALAALGEAADDLPDDTL